MKKIKAIIKAVFLIIVIISIAKSCRPKSEQDDIKNDLANNITTETQETTKRNDIIEGFVVEESPFTYTFDENEYVVGNCSVILRKVEIVNTIHKAYPDNTTYAKFIRIQATVRNNSPQEVYLTNRKTGSYLIGKYYGNDGETDIGWNNNYKWKIDSDIKTDYGWTIGANQTKDICVSGVFIDSDRLKYDDEPKLDLYFVSEEETLTITIN